MIARLVCRILGHRRYELATIILNDPARIALALTCRRCGAR